MNKFFKLIIPAFLLMVFAFASLSCNQNGVGIFYSAVDEKPLNNSIFDEKTVSEIVSDNTNYYINTGMIYKKALASAEIWSSEDILDAPANYSICISIENLGTEIFAVFTSTDGSLADLFKLNDITWERVGADETLLSGRKSIIGTGDAIFINVSQTDGSFDVISTTDGATFTSELSGLSSPVIDSDKNNTEYWLLSATNVFSGASGGITVLDSTDSPPETPVFSGIFYSDELSLLLISSKSGYIYTLADGSTDWTTLDQILLPSDFAVELSDFCEITLGATTVLAVGSNNGYYESTDDGSTFSIPGSSSLTTDSNYANIDLRNSYVHEFLVTASTFYACTDNGIWKNVDKIWNRE